MTATDSLIVPEGCRAVIWGSVNGRSRLCFDVRTEDVLKFLELYVEYTRAEIYAREAVADDDCWD